ncbi:MAG: DUF4388 domain-containing protein [Acidimicrobiales bacterium]
MEVTVSLQGSLETFEIPDVLVLLASTKKTGELRVVGGQVDGRLWFEGGEIVQATVSGRPVQHVDGVFQILRLAQGTFSFESDIKAPKPTDGEKVESVLGSAQERLSEWRDIAKVVPHLDCTLAMTEALPADEVLVDQGQWKILVKVAGGASVRQLMDSTGASEFDACRSVRELIDAELLSIDTSVKPRSARTEPAKGISVPVDEAVSPNSGSSSGSSGGGSSKTNGNANGNASAPAPTKTEAPPEKSPEADKKVPERDAAGKAAARAASEVQKIRAHSATPDAPAEGSARPVTATKASLSGDVSPAKPAAKADDKADDKADANDSNALVAQLAALGVDENDEEMQERVAEHLAKGGELPMPEGDEPINRGLLLKFLSSVRN